MLIWLPLILIAVCCALYVDWGEVEVVPGRRCPGLPVNDERNEG